MMLYRSSHLTDCCVVPAAASQGDGIHIQFIDETGNYHLMLRACMECVKVICMALKDTVAEPSTIYDETTIQ